MNFEQAAVFAIIGGAMILFVWGRLRYDLVGVMALLAGVSAGVVKPEEAFVGFGHAAVITVAAVLVISKALQNSGLVDHLVHFLAPSRKTTTLQIAAGCTMAAAFSSFMNNVGALALMLPVTVKNAFKAGRSPSLVLIPLSFASLLGGLVTLIGTPPNIVVSSFRQQHSGEPFAMFDFAPVGLVVAIAGLCYLTMIGWRFLPERVPVGGKDDSLFHVETYTFETNVPDGSPLAGIRVRDLERMFENEIAVMAIIRGDIKRLAPRAIEKLRANDVLILQGDPALIQPLADDVKLGALRHQISRAEAVRSDEVDIIEAVVMPNSQIEGKSMRGFHMHERFGINLLALARSGRRPTARLQNIRFKSGDVLLLQGESATMSEALATLGCLALAPRSLGRRPLGRRVVLPIVVFAAAITATALGLVTVPIALLGAVATLIMTSTITASEVYESIEWPVIILLATLIPIGEAMQHTGGTELIASALLDVAADIPFWVIVALLLTVSMWLSDLVHNTPTAILMAPVAAEIANKLGVNADGLLMAVAVGAASPYLTPIGHQSNTLVLGPGGYHFADYARVGLPMELLIVTVATPLIMLVWPPI